MKHDSLARLRRITYDFLEQKGIKITPEEHKQLKAVFQEYGRIYHQQEVKRLKLIKPIRNEANKPPADKDGFRTYPYET